MMTSRSRCRAAFLTLFLFLYGTAAFAAPAPENFAYSMCVSGPMTKGEMYRLPLSADVLVKCERNCDDMRLFDQSGREAPFVIIETRRVGGDEHYPLKITEFMEDKSGAVLVAKMPERAEPLAALALVTSSKDYYKSVVVYGSNDLKRWSLLAREQMYDFTSKVNMRKVDVKFAASDFRYYKLVMKDMRQSVSGQALRLVYNGVDLNIDGVEGAKLVISGLEGKTAPSGRGETVYDSAVIRAFRADKDGNRLTVEAGLPLDRITFDISNPVYHRAVRVYAGESSDPKKMRFLADGLIYRPPHADAGEVKDTIEVRADNNRFYSFIIEGGERNPLEIKSLTLSWAVRNIYFIAPGDASEYLLAWGASDVSRPDYDIVKFINQSNWYKYSPARLAVGSIVKNQSYIPFSSDRRGAVERHILKGIIVLLVIGMGFWLFSLLKRRE